MSGCMHTPSSKERHGGASPAVGLTDGSILLVQVCQQEHALFQHFFAAETGEQALAALLQPEAHVVHTASRADAVTCARRLRHRRTPASPPGLHARGPLEMPSPPCGTARHKLVALPPSPSPPSPLEKFSSG